MIRDRLDARTLRNMEVALDRACHSLAIGEQHDARSHVAARILECAQRGETRLDALIEAGQVAATELSVTHGV